MSKAGRAALGLFAMGALLMVLSTAPVGAVEGEPCPLQPSPRPPWNPTESPDPTEIPKPGSSSSSGSSSDQACQSVCGYVINLDSNQGEPGVTVRFADIDTQSDAAGRYGYGLLGLDVQRLSVVSDGASDLQPSTHDIAFAPPPGMPVAINLGVHRGDVTVGPLVVPELSVLPGSAHRGERVIFTVQVHNTLDGAMSGVWVTDLLPDGLTLVAVTSDRGDIVRSGNYGAVSTWLGAGERMTVSIHADVDADAPQGAVHNTVSLIYSEHAAAQATVRLDVGNPGPATLPQTGLPLANCGTSMVLSLVMWAVRWLRLHYSR